MMKIRKRRRGIAPILLLVLVIFIPVFLWVAWQIAKIFIGEVKEKV